MGATTASGIAHLFDDPAQRSEVVVAFIPAVAVLERRVPCMAIAFVEGRGYR